MKKMNTIFNGFRNKYLVIFFTFSFLLTTQIAAARPMFGSSTETFTAQCGDCVCTYATTTTYIFWINVGSSTEWTGVDCN